MTRAGLGFIRLCSKRAYVVRCQEHYREVDVQVPLKLLDNGATSIRLLMKNYRGEMQARHEPCNRLFRGLIAAMHNEYAVSDWPILFGPKDWSGFGMLIYALA